MMDAHDITTISMNGATHETGTCEELSEYKEEGISSEIVAKKTDYDSGIKLADGKTDASSHENETIGSVLEEVEESNNLDAFKELQVRDTDESTEPKFQTMDKVKNRKALGVKNDTKQKIDRKEPKKMSIVSSGSIASGASAKQSITHEKKSIGLKDRQVVDNNSKKKINLSKQHGKSDAISPTENVVQLEGAKSSISGDEKPQRLGTLPVYNFSFKCNERAEKRKEFYSKLEEKIHAKEMEKCNLQEKTKENQEAEMKMFRKSLTFKATPMPSFYKEPSLPKIEVKKIPATRAKSPKFGRKKESSTRDTETELNNGEVFQLVRLSLDEKKLRNKPTTKGLVPVPLKRPVRNSLPRLPSEKTKLPPKPNNGKELGSDKRNKPESQNKDLSNTHEADSPTEHVLEEKGEFLKD